MIETADITPQAIKPTLYVITPVTRHQNLEKIAGSISAARDRFEVVWLRLDEPRDDPWGNRKRNLMLDQVEREARPDAWVKFLDDDNVLHPDFPALAFQAINEHSDADALLFFQQNHDGTQRTQTTPPKLQECSCDTDQILVRARSLHGCRWTPDRYEGDWTFVAALIQQNIRFVTVPRFASYYNRLCLGDPNADGGLPEGSPPVCPRFNMPVSSPLYPSRVPSVGVVIGTFAAAPYVHLQLESWRRNYPQIPLLVSDDASPMADELRKLCARYDAAFISNPSRLRQTVGDLSAYVNGFDWARPLGLEILVKFSRRFIPLYDWAPGLRSLAFESQMPTFSQSCDHFNFGFRTECVAFHCENWRESGAYEKIRDQVAWNEPIFVEGFLHRLARQVAGGNACEEAVEYLRNHPRPPDRDGYAAWGIMPDRRTTRTPALLWHDSDGPFDYARAAAMYGLPYTQRDFEDANQSFGVGQP